MGVSVILVCFAIWGMAYRGYRAYECFRIACES
ncbi:hypothetical protein EAIG_04608 [Escherichia coli B108]|nr:hypothetical protein EAIG_04608 [Escherichia coli B108]